MFLVISVMTLISLWLDSNSDARFLICCTSLVCHIIYMIFLGTILPNNGQTCPRIGKYIILLYIKSYVLFLVHFTIKKNCLVFTLQCIVIVQSSLNLDLNPLEK